VSHRTHPTFEKFKVLQNRVLKFWLVVLFLFLHMPSNFFKCRRNNYLDIRRQMRAFAD
jgi:hypothetical protein